MDARRAAGVAALVAAAVAIGQGLVGLGIASQGQDFESNWLFSGAFAFAVVALVPGVWLLVSKQKEAFQNSDPDLQVDELESDRIPNWENDWRISVRATNRGESDEFTAYLLAPVEGIAKPNYGDINLQWDTVNTPFSTLISGKPERLHVARLSSRRTLRFLSPGQTGGKPREFQQAEIKVTDSPVIASIVFNTRQGRCQSRRLEIHLDNENTPTVRVGDPEPC